MEQRHGEANHEAHEEHEER